VAIFFEIVWKFGEVQSSNLEFMTLECVQ